MKHLVYPPKVFSFIRENPHNPRLPAVALKRVGGFSCVWFSLGFELKKEAGISPRLLFSVTASTR
jgi:hypothetical protein